jgi:molybdopterin-containing oxidoreductase family iron-sulfur binding subunit
VGKAFWRSLDDLSESPQFRELVAREFPQLAEDILDPRTRREFLKIMAASLGMLSLASCRWPKETILPFAGRPEERIPGVPQQFATAMALFGNALGLLVTSYDGRPIKIEGNPLHPESEGAAHLWAQASILELYDPDRSQVVARRQAGQRVVSSWEAFRAQLQSWRKEFLARGGEGLWILADGTLSPTRMALREQLLQQLPRARWVDWDPLLRSQEEQGLRQATGQQAAACLHLQRARVIVSLADDLFLRHPQGVSNARAYAHRRRDLHQPLRLYVAEPVPTVTGAAADKRLACSPGELTGLLLGLAKALQGQGVKVPLSLPEAPNLNERQRAFVQAAAADLARAGAQGVVAVGPALPPACHALAFALNQGLGAVGSTVSYVPAPVVASQEDLGLLRQALERGQVRLLLVLGGNPAVTASSHLGGGELLARAENLVRLGLYEDETSRYASWHIPQAHWLEAWGDVQSLEGIYSVTQPLIAPLYDGKTPEELLALFLGQETSAYELVRATFAQLAGGTFAEKAWRKTLHDGLWEGRLHGPLALRLTSEGWVSQLSAAQKEGQLWAWLEPDSKVLDGRFANNAWLQELPEPITKLTWGNALLMSPETAGALHLKHGEVVQAEVNGRELSIPVFLVPGVAAGTVGLASGYGRQAAGRVGDGVGVGVSSGAEAWGFAPVTSLRGTGRRGDVVSTQDQQAIDRLGLEALGHRLGELIRQVTPEQPAVKAKGELKPPMPWQERPFTGQYQWGMVVDLAACIGCGACVIACQAENNIPVVGKKQVARGRQMHWIRIDRYFAGAVEEPGFAFQPVMCQHCENAPCEQVCPVAATLHNEEGLNQMVYNRCVGTRYCSNNCPYKVRRFNYFNYFKHTSEVAKLGFNPEVTIRGRGVMEKCTFCIQRIEKAKIAARNEGQPLRDGAVVPACAQTCPTQAIVFGNLADPQSQVAKLHQDPRAYGILTELNTRPRVLYLAKITNPPEGA